MSRVKLVFIILIIVVFVPLVYIYNGINRHCAKVASKATCGKMDFRDKLTIFINPRKN